MKTYCVRIFLALLGAGLTIWGNLYKPTVDPYCTVIPFAQLSEERMQPVGKNPGLVLYRGGVGDIPVFVPLESEYFTEIIDLEKRELDYELRTSLQVVEIFDSKDLERVDRPAHVVIGLEPKAPKN
jgi:hypothetical protein